MLAGEGGHGGPWGDAGPITCGSTTGQGLASGIFGMEVACTRCGEMAGARICSSLTGNLQWRLVYRTAATSKASPGAWANVDANTYGAAEVNTGDLALSLGTNMWVQFVIGYFLSSAGSGQATLAAAIGTRRS